MSISQSASPTAESETCAICSTVPDAADRRMVCAQCVDAFFAGSKPASESAEELARRLGEGFNGRFAGTFEGAVKTVATLIAADRAEVKREAADRFAAKLEECIDILPNKVEGIITGSDIERLISAILGEGKA